MILPIDTAQADKLLIMPTYSHYDELEYNYNDVIIIFINMPYQQVSTDASFNDETDTWPNSCKGTKSQSIGAEFLT